MRGDINTIGISGATIALPTTISATELNPAGFAMLTGSVTAQINETSFSDPRIQRSGDPIASSQWGLGLSPEGWGFSIAYYSPETESGTYVSPNTGDTVVSEVSMKDLRFTVGRLFLDDSLAIAGSIDVLKGVRELNSASSDAYGLGYHIGMLYRLPKHLLFGASYTPTAAVAPSTNPDSQTILPDFNRTVLRPSQAGFGIGWMPNRFFKAGASLTYVGATVNTALFADQSVTTGAVPTWVPRFGVSYVVAQFSNLKVETSCGAYFEESRLSDQGSRTHFTAGIEANPSFLNVGAGFDISRGYRNFIISFGIDIIRTARAYNIIPKDPIPAYNGAFPRALDISADGLPNALTKGEKRLYSSPTSVEEVGNIMSTVPEKFYNKIIGPPVTIGDVKAEKKVEEEIEEEFKEENM